MKRPTSVTVFGVLNIVFAGFGILSMLGMVALFALVGKDSHNPVVELIQNNPGYALWMKVSMVLGLVVSVLLVAAGIGLLMLKPWARTVSIGYAIYSFIMIVAGTVVNYFLMLRPMLEQAHQKQGPEAAAAIGGAVGGTVGSCFGLVYPVLLLIFMLRADVKSAFAKPPALPPGAGTTPL